MKKIDPNVKSAKTETVESLKYLPFRSLDPTVSELYPGLVSFNGKKPEILGKKELRALIRSDHLNSETPTTKSTKS